MRLLNIIGLIIFSIGALALIGFGFFQFIGEFLIETKIPLIVRLGVIGLILGTTTILISLILERLKDEK